ncbi:MAG: hypothetical protein ACE5D6_09150, partial [Candidatus Zixiibacteriota bacterium]
INRTRRALEEYRVSGLKTTIGFSRAVMDNKNFIDGNISTGFLKDEFPDNQFITLNDSLKEQAALAVALDKFIMERKITVNSHKKDNLKQSAWVTFHRRNNLQTFKGSR